MMKKYTLRNKANSPHTKKFLMTRFGRLVERISYFDLLIFTLASLIGSAIYFSVTKQIKVPNGEDFNFGVALYFSLVTFTTLGYGDFFPLGFGRSVACINAILGVFLASLFIGKIASERLSATLVLLHTSDVERRLAGFSAELRDNSSLKIVTANDSKERIRKLQNIISGCSRYIAFNANQARIADFGNDSSFREVCEAVLKTTYFAKAIMIEIDIPQYAETKKHARDLLDSCGSFLELIEKIQGKTHPESLILPNLYWKFISNKASRSGILIEREKRRYKKLKSEASAADLELWTVEQLDKLLEMLPVGVTSTWPKGVHKEIARSLNLSNTTISRQISFLFNRGVLPK